MVGSVRMDCVLLWGLVVSGCGGPSSPEASEESEPSEAAPPGGAGPSAAPDSVSPAAQAGSTSAAGGAPPSLVSAPNEPSRPSNATRLLPPCAEIASACSPEVVASDLTNPLLLRPLADGVYLRSGDEIVRLAPDGTRSSIRNAAGLIYFEVQTDGTLYYATSLPAAVYRGELDDPATDEVLVSDPSSTYGFWGFTVTATDLWQGTAQDTMRLPKDGSAGSVVSGTSCVDLVSDDAWVHCRAAQSIVTIDPATELAVVREQVQGTYSDIEVTSARVYWTIHDESSGVRDLSRAQSAPGSPVETVSVSVQPNTFAPDDAGVYFTARESIEGVAVYYLSDAGSSAVPVVRDDSGVLLNGSTGIDATHVYWSMAPYDLPTQGVVWRAPRCGCP